MSAALTFWKRVEDLFRPRARLLNRNETGRIGYAGVSLDPPAKPEAGNGSSLAPWSRWGGRHAELRENFLKVSESLDQLHERLQRGEQRDTEVGDTLRDIRASLESLTGQQARQHELMDQICTRLAEMESRGNRIATALQELPAALRAQADAVQAVGGQLEVSRETDASLRDSLNSFERAASEMRESGAVQLETLSRLQNAQEGSREELESALKRQNRRFLWVAGISTVLSLAALGLLVANLVATGLLPLSRIFSTAP